MARLVDMDGEEKRQSELWPHGIGEEGRCNTATFETRPPYINRLAQQPNGARDETRMTQEERWITNFEAVKTFITENGRNLSKYILEERRLYTWLKHNRKQMNAGTLKQERVEKFRELLALCEQYKHKNQYE